MGRRDERILSCVFMAIVRYHFLNGESKLIFNYWLALIGKNIFIVHFFITFAYETKQKQYRTKHAIKSNSKIKKDAKKNY